MQYPLRHGLCHTTRGWTAHGIALTYVLPINDGRVADPLEYCYFVLVELAESD
jgi:hypothetical protein